MKFPIYILSFLMLYFANAIGSETSQENLLLTELQKTVWSLIVQKEVFKKPRLVLQTDGTNREFSPCTPEQASEIVQRTGLPLCLSEFLIGTNLEECCVRTPTRFEIRDKETHKYFGHVNLDPSLSGSFRQ